MRGPAPYRSRFACAPVDRTRHLLRCRRHLLCLSVGSLARCVEPLHELGRGTVIFGTFLGGRGRWRFDPTSDLESYDMHLRASEEAEIVSARGGSAPVGCERVAGLVRGTDCSQPHPCPRLARPSASTRAARSLAPACSCAQRRRRSWVQVSQQDAARRAGSAHRDATVAADRSPLAGRLQAALRREDVRQVTDAFSTGPA